MHHPDLENPKMITAMPRRAAALLALAAAALMAKPAVAAPLDYCPSEAEVVVWMNFKQLAKPAAEWVKNELGREDVDRVAKVAQNMTDIDVFNDIEEAALFAKIDNPKAVVIVVGGTFKNPQKLIDLVQLNESYESYEEGTLTIHKWKDDGEKFACFPEPNVLLIATSEEALSTALESPKSGGFESLADERKLPKTLGKHHAWGVILHNGSAEGDFGHLADTVGLNLLLGTLDLANNEITVTARAFPDEPELNKEYENIVTGALSAMKLLKSEHEALELLSDKTQPILGEAPGAELKLTLDELMSLKDMQ